MVDKKQQQMKQEIASYQAKKDYYEVLGIAKTATDGQIKKAYRMLALRFHPDKNQFQGAKEVFKKISNAYSILIDPEKRAHYDRYGPQEEQPRPQHRQNYAYAQSDDQFQQYDDIFRAFFGGMPHQQHRRGNVYTYSFGGGRGGQRPQGQQREQNGFNFYYIFIIFFIIYTIAPLFESKPNFSTVPSGEYKFRTKTSILNVDFYVNQRFFEESRDANYKRNAEMLIDRQRIVTLERGCENAKKQKRRYEEFAYRERPGARREGFINQAKAVDIGACRILNDYRIEHEDYMRDLTYMR